MRDGLIYITTVAILMIAAEFYRRYKKSNKKFLKYLTKIIAAATIIILTVIAILIVFATYGYFVDKNTEVTIKLAITGLLFIPSAIFLIKNFIRDIKN